MARHGRPVTATALVACLISACAAPSTGPTPGASSPSVTPSPAATLTVRPTPTPGPTLPPGVTLAARLGLKPSGILALGDVLWAEDHSEKNRFFAIHPANGSVLTTLEAARPCDFVAAYDRLWLIDLGTGRLTSVDPGTRAVLEVVASGFENPCGPQAAGGAIWFAADPGFARVDVESGASRVIDTGGATFPAPGVTPSGKSMWGVVYDTAELVRIDLETGKVELRVPPPGPVTEEEPAAVAFGSLWVGNGPAQRVFRLDPKTASRQAEIEAGHPTRFLVTNDALWLTSYPTGVVERIDPATNEVVFHARLGGNLNGITDGFGAIWVGDTASGNLYRIDPAAVGVFD